MKRITYGGASFLTTDTIADALLPLVAALGISHTTETLELPAVNNDGKTMIVKLIVGPMSELISIPEESPWEEPDTTTVLAYILARTQTALSAPHPDSFSETIAFTDFDAETDHSE
jgi:hypothetical protein